MAGLFFACPSVASETDERAARVDYPDTNPATQGTPASVRLHSAGPRLRYDGVAWRGAGRSLVSLAFHVKNCWINGISGRYRRGAGLGAPGQPLDPRGGDDADEDLGQHLA